MRERQEGVVDSGRSVREDTKRKKECLLRLRRHLSWVFEHGTVVVRGVLQNLRFSRKPACFIVGTEHAS